MKKAPTLKRQARRQRALDRFKIHQSSDPDYLQRKLVEQASLRASLGL